MGGYHSGTWERWGARRLVEETRNSDVRELHRRTYDRLRPVPRL